MQFAYIFTYAHTRACTHTRVHTHTHTHIQIRAHTQKRTHTHAHTYTLAHTHTHTHTHKHTHTHARTHAHTHTHTHTSSYHHKLICMNDSCKSHDQLITCGKLVVTLPFLAHFVLALVILHFTLTTLPATMSFMLLARPHSCQLDLIIILVAVTLSSAPCPPTLPRHCSFR